MVSIRETTDDHAIEQDKKKRILDEQRSSYTLALR